jgi:hypothetical protein
MSEQPGNTSPSGRYTRIAARRRFAILAIPYLWLVGAIPFVGYRDQTILNIPVLEVWMLAGVIVCSACLAAASHGRQDPVAEYVRTRLPEEDRR